jgi:ubiquinone/menaquinone biosynthesis C-methylase UbiE
MAELTDSKTEKVARIIRRIHQAPMKKMLVVGCGSGLEAAILSEHLQVETIGIDVQENFDARALKRATLQKGDAMALEFADESFDFVFSYHALEHIENPPKALREINRVLKKGGGFWIGTPNRSRIVGYIGGKETSLSQKISWNLADWRARAAGRFYNELGAHAGFTARELESLLAEVFPSVKDMTETYFYEIYENRQSTIKLIVQAGFARYIFPSVYFSGIK